MAGCVLLGGSAAAQAAPAATLETSETIFSVLAALNACGYDRELAVSEPVRQQVRGEVARAAQVSPEGRAALEEVCAFYRDHRQDDETQDLAQYVSLALNLGAPPGFAPLVKEADLPPDASYVLGLAPRLQHFYASAGLHQIWGSHKDTYDALVARYHEPVARLISDTDLYLRRPLSNYTDRRLTVFLEPLAPPGQVNARNYGDSYFMVMAPAQGPLRLDALRHTYLHFVLDPLAAQRQTSLARLAPILDTLRAAPMNQKFKTDISLLVTESLIRAIEARTAVSGRNSKRAETERARLTRQAAQEGFVLAPYFGRQLAIFEKSDEGLLVAYPNWLHDISVEEERKFAKHIKFASAATLDAIHTSPGRPPSLLRQAQQALAAGDVKHAGELAQQALDQKSEDQALALFILAQVFTINKDMEGARGYFERTLVVAHEPRLIAWSHIYLGRICDLQAERNQALDHYRAALQAGDSSAEVRQAAEHGLRQPFEPPGARARSGSNSPAAEPESKN